MNIDKLLQRALMITVIGSLIYYVGSSAYTKYQRSERVRIERAQLSQRCERDKAEHPQRIAQLKAEIEKTNAQLSGVEGVSRIPQLQPWQERYTPPQECVDYFKSLEPIN